MGHDEIYEWQANSDDGKLTCKHYGFGYLPFEKITNIDFMPLIEGIAPLQFKTNRQPFIYKRRVVWNITEDILDYVYYVFGTEGDFFVLKYPDMKTFKIEKYKELENVE